MVFRRGLPGFNLGGPFETSRRIRGFISATRTAKPADMKKEMCHDAEGGYLRDLRPKVKPGITYEDENEETVQ
jgi:hypothetical protein